MIVEELCPKCGGTLTDLCLASYPPQYLKECFNCGWTSETKQEEIIKIPYKIPDTTDKSNEKTDSPVTTSTLSVTIERLNIIKKLYEKIIEVIKDDEEIWGIKNSKNNSIIESAKENIDALEVATDILENTYLTVTNIDTNNTDDKIQHVYIN